MCRATQPKHTAAISEDIMARTSRLLIEDHHDQSLRIQKADEVRRALLSCLIELGPTTRR